MKKLLIKCKSLKQGLKHASRLLNAPVEELDYEIKTLRRGLLGPKECEILVWRREESDIPQAEGEETPLSNEALDNMAKEVVDVDGFYRIEITPNKVYLSVFPPQGNGTPVRYEKVLTEFLERNIDVDADLIKRIISEARGERVPVADWHSSPDMDAKVNVEVSKDEMKAYITLIPPQPGGRDLVFEEVIEKLKDAGIVKGIKEDVIQRVLDNKIYNEQILVAEGKPPKDGEDAKVNYKFRTEKIRTSGFIDETGRIDYKNLDLIENVVQSQLLAEKIPPTEGEPGYTVTGRELPAKPGKDIKIPVGKNVILSDDGMEATAAINGEVSLIDGKITVNPVYTVNGNVNLETGNIVFLGNVEIKGNVEDNFSVKASGDIRVGGTVGKAFLEADGDIFVAKGILGHNEGRVYAEGNVYAKFIEAGNVTAGRNIFVFEVVMHSNISAGENIIVTGKKGLIVGGTARAKDEIYALNVGSMVSTPTTLEVGADPHLREKLKKLNEERKDIKNQLRRIRQGIKTLEDMREKLTVLPPEKEQMLGQFLNAQLMLEEKLDYVERHIVEAESKVVSSKKGIVSVRDTVYPGVKIVIKDKIYIVKEELKYISFVFSEGDIKILPYKEVKQELRKEMQKR